jgi:glycopeptide antibiotics resistance protein
MTASSAYAIGAAAAVAFAVWGSLFPFVVFPTAPAAALHAFVGAWGGGPATWSISDFVSNVLLFVPIGLLGAAAVQSRGVSARGAIVSVLLGTTLLSMAVELTQAWIRWRTSSVVDVLAEQGGCAAGIAAWLIGREWISAGVEWACEALRTATPLQRALVFYCAAFAVFWLLPLDLTLRPGEIADKAFHKRLLLPFTPSPDALTPGELALAAFAAIPLGVAAAHAGVRRGVRAALDRAVRFALPGMFALELCQVFVFSRTTDMTVVLPLSAGIVAGALVASR